MDIVDNFESRQHTALYARGGLGADSTDLGMDDYVVPSVSDVPLLSVDTAVKQTARWRRKGPHMGPCMGPCLGTWGPPRGSIARAGVEVHEGDALMHGAPHGVLTYRYTWDEGIDACHAWG